MVVMVCFYDFFAVVFLTFIAGKASGKCIGSSAGQSVDKDRDFLILLQPNHDNLRKDKISQ